MEVTTAALPALLGDVFQAGLVPMIHGSPAIGKSRIIEQIAEQFNLKVIDVRLSQSDPTDLNGFPKINGDKATYIPMDTFPIVGDPIPEGYSGWLIFLDEINSAPLSVQAASYKLVLDKQVGKHDLHPNVAIAAAGNLSTDKAIVNRMSTAMQSRLAHFTLIIEPKAWQKWAAKAEIDYRIISFIGFKPSILFNFKPDHNGHTYASPRTWEFMSKLIKKYKEIPAEKLPLLASVVDDAAAREFFVYAEIFKDLITIPQIMADPVGIRMPTEPSIQYALSGSISQHINKDNANTIMIFLKRMGVEFQILCLQQAFAINKDLIEISVIKDWVKIYAKELF